MGLLYLLKGAVIRRHRKFHMEDVSGQTHVSEITNIPIEQVGF
jgi:hypothetical protein